MSKDKPAWGEKASAIRAALKANPHLKNRELVALLTEQGVVCSTQDVASQKARNKQLGKDATVLSLDALLKIKNTVKAAGGLKVVQHKMEEIDQLNNSLPSRKCPEFAWHDSVEGGFNQTVLVLV